VKYSLLQTILKYNTNSLIPKLTIFHKVV